MDIGSVKAPSKFAWAAVDSAEPAAVVYGDDPEGAVQALSQSLAHEGRAVLAVEAPMAIPVPAPDSDAWRVLGRARSGEGNRPWSAAAGAGALATGVAQTAWMLSRLHTLVPEASATTRPERFAAGQARLLLAEAFVSGTGKPVPVAAGQHAADAGSRRPRDTDLPDRRPGRLSERHLRTAACSQSPCAACHLGRYAGAR
ncbi:hypothetical protein [Streptomyces platensis]|uniref:hypothetical protein n=1 Tax=Streptomyces platensis TaxID=58346 RepID=UPI001F41B5E0|nr:hypothetical protein [Streptomyces platensis]MCF3141650.1 hypothetical protein [Streptomyces platensis]